MNEDMKEDVAKMSQPPLDKENWDQDPIESFTIPRIRTSKKALRRAFRPFLETEFTEPNPLLKRPELPKMCDFIDREIARLETRRVEGGTKNTKKSKRKAKAASKSEATGRDG